MRIIARPAVRPWETFVQPNEINAGDSRLRYVFSGTVVSVRHGGTVTYGEIARKLEVLNQRYGHPLAIDVTLGSHTRAQRPARSLSATGGPAR